MQEHNKRRRERALSSERDQEYAFDGENPTNEYIIVRNDQGKDVYKRRFVNKGRVKKERPEGYYEEK